ncbi:hypothetical protein QM806_04275 [Rhodococcus sp. IEGM 1351]|uniref:hypothetical protein n=1 Tax=Rhodococcus sp. IEGM 1351 TaxID=3047089 RepID=UPI0024B6FFC9|nr:hypothetical protein [Rhodococcus sp. IEGM 1351]MDI9934670.1 hypothetical protein [Rhodococcus sp. IEGM 1351]
MTIALNEDAVKSIEKLLDDAHDMADAVDDLREENTALAVILLVALNAYLEHVQAQIVRLIPAN